MAFISDKGFILWLYTCSMGRLVLKSQEVENKIIDQFSELETTPSLLISFWEVVYMDIPTQMDGLAIKRAEIIPPDLQNYLRVNPGITLFQIESREEKYFIVARGGRVQSEQGRDQDNNQLDPTTMSDSSFFQSL